MGKLQPHARNPEWVKSGGSPVYSRAEKITIWEHKLRKEFFTGRKPSASQKFTLRAAAILIVDLSQIMPPPVDFLKPSPQRKISQQVAPMDKYFWQRFTLLQRLLASFTPRTTKLGRPPKVSQETASLGLASLLSGDGEE